MMPEKFVKAEIPSQLGVQGYKAKSFACYFSMYLMKLKAKAKD